MFERAFQWTIQHGSRLLFAVACVIFALGVVVVIIRFVNTNPVGGAGYDLPFGNVMMLLGGLLSALREAAIPLAAAIALGRFDQWISQRRTSGSSD